MTIHTNDEDRAALSVEAARSEVDWRINQLQDPLSFLAVSRRYAGLRAR
jgi:hypothetical protein